jgi:NADH:ubiquinone oxidoreductase subunit 5 (subunit L)/multisubunit Na+/H+ antiporter MnhA subunit
LFWFIRRSKHHCHWAVTSLVGNYWHWFKPTSKKYLAYSTVSQLGLMFLALTWCLWVCFPRYHTRFL